VSLGRKFTTVFWSMSIVVLAARASIADASTVMTLVKNYCTNPTSVYKDTRSGVVYAACYNSGVIAINDTAVTIIATSSQCSNAQSVYKDTSSGVVYAACNFDGVVSVAGSRESVIGPTYGNPVSRRSWPLLFRAGR
jgi:hypothetical protein